MTEEALKKAKTLRLLFRALFALIAFITPIIIVAIKFELITKFTGYKLSVIGLFTLILIVWRFKKRLGEWINSWEYSILKYILIGFSRVYLFIFAIILLGIAQKGLTNILFCFEWIAVCEVLSYMVIYPLEEKYDHQVKRILRGIERKSDYKEAIRELEKENKE